MCTYLIKLREKSRSEVENEVEQITTIFYYYHLLALLLHAASKTLEAECTQLSGVF